MQRWDGSRWSLDVLLLPQRRGRWWSLADDAVVGTEGGWQLVAGGWRVMGAASG